jgi:hypothetical protein
MCNQADIILHLILNRGVPALVFNIKLLKDYWLSDNSIRTKLKILSSIFRI